MQKTIDLILRVKSLVGARDDFFDAVCGWYENAQRYGGLARKLLARCSARPRASLLVNGRLVGEAIIVPPEARHVSWAVPAGVLVRGDNDVTVYRERGPGPKLPVRAATAAQELGLPWQNLDLSVAEPAPTKHLWLEEVARARHAGDCWPIKEDGFLSLRLRLAETNPVAFSIRLAGAPEGDLDLDDLLEDVLERVQAKLQELEEERGRLEQVNPTRAARLAEEVQVLGAYAYLHRAQIQPAFRNGDGTTRKEVIARTGDPDRLVRDALAWAPVLVAPPAPAAPPAAPRAPAAPAAPAAGAGWLLTFLLVAVLVSGPLVWLVRSGALAWGPGAQQRESAGILEALRRSADELGWKRDVETEQMAPAAAVQERFAAGARAAGPLSVPSPSEGLRMYAVGEAGAAPRDAVASWRRELGVFDLGSPEAAAAYLALAGRPSAPPRELPKSDSRPLVVIFVLDTTASMGPYIAGLKRQCIAFADKVKETKRPCRLGLIGFGDVKFDRHPFAIYESTENVDLFKSRVANVPRTDGGDVPEPAVDALEHALKMAARENGEVCLVLITDAPCHRRNEIPRVARELRERSIRTYVVAQEAERKLYEPLCVNGGKLHALTAARFEHLLGEVARDVRDGQLDARAVTVRLTVRGADEAVGRQAITPRGRGPLLAVARVGRHVLVTTDKQSSPPDVEAREAERRLAVLVAKMRKHLEKKGASR